MAWTTTHPSLLRRLRDPDDEAAWRRFDRLYGRLIVAYACRRGLDLADAEDVRQIVLLGLVRSLPRFEFRPERGRFRSYLGRVVGNAILRYERRPHRRWEVLEGDGGVLADVHDPTDPDDVWEQEWQDFHLRRALAFVRTNSDPNSVAIFERLLAGESVVEVAEACGTTRDAVHKVKQRLRDRLRRRIGEQLAEEAEA